MLDWIINFFIRVFKFFLDLFIACLVVYVILFIWKYCTDNGCATDKIKNKRYTCFGNDNFPIPPVILEQSPDSVVKCPYCGGEIHGNEKFCPYCDREKELRFYFTFHRNKMSEHELVGRINDWFSHASGIDDLECNFVTRDTVALFVPTGRIKDVAIFYRQKEEGGSTYGIDIMDSFTFFKKSPESLIEKWQKDHPEREVIKYDSLYYMWGGILSFIFGGFGGANKTKLFIVYKMK